ncbi:glycosyltransferase [Arenibacter sp. F26102]|uniref:glycosyltransferase n=1 Tax=Arenibacter sp. F26102 TaxID=2926416 RepID=UPI001FF6FC00|nr:glycosyltransferase [Arenibacter sp. F26102]MCK0147058.1 glycosyltransferase [Arenibacter sp. F26102]
MRLSIVIPCYNMEKYLPKCVDSLFAQDVDPSVFEVIIVNDESKDTTYEIALAYQLKYPNIKVIDKKNAGVGAARNSGLDKSTGTYVYFLDPDDYLAKNVLGMLLKTIEEYNLDILCFNSLDVADDSKHNSSTNIDSIEAPVVKDGITYIASNKYRNEIWWFLIKREFILDSNIRFIEGKWMEDAILSAQLFCKAKKMAHLDLDAHRYRILPTSAMRNKSPEHYNKVIFDNANAAHSFDQLIKSIPANHKNSDECIKRLKTRQQSFVFFLLVRLMKSDIPINKIPDMLFGFEKIDAYPLKKFLGKDYHGFSYSFMVYIFNHKPLINPFIKIFRTFYNLAR